MDNVLKDFAEQFQRCWLCGARQKHTWHGLDIHHIVRGARRARARGHRAALIRACRYCHTSRLDGMSIVRQLALKWLWDPEGYDLWAVNRLRGRADDAVTQDEVLTEVASLERDAIGNGYSYPREW